MRFGRINECRVHVAFASELVCAIVLMMSGGVYASTFTAGKSLKTDILSGSARDREVASSAQRATAIPFG